MDVVRAVSAIGLALVADNAAFAQETTLASIDSAGVHGVGTSRWPAISGDGRLVAFTSSSDNLVAGDTNLCWDVFVHDGVTGVTERVSVDSLGAQGNGTCESPAISANGQVVSFASASSNLVIGDTNGKKDVFIHDRVTGITERVSIDSSGAQADGDSTWTSISVDGRFVAFDSLATNLVYGDTNGKSDVFVHDRTTGTTVLVSVGASAVQANGTSALSVISNDGRVVAFQSDATNLVVGDKNSTTDIFVHDLSTGTTERATVDSSGTEANDLSLLPALSADGNLVAFESDATNLVAGDTNGWRDVFVRDRAQGTTERMSLGRSGAETNQTSGLATISGDGSRVGFSSRASNLVDGDNSGWWDIFVYDRTTGVTVRASVDSSGVEGDYDSSYYLPSALSSNGLVIAFDSDADNLVRHDINGYTDVFVHDLCTTFAWWFNYGAGFPGTYGIPSFTARQNPAFGSTITLDLANSYSGPTYGVMFVGLQRTSIHSRWGGDLLVVPSLSLLVSLSYGFESFTGTIPNEVAWCGLGVDLQAIEADPYAAKGVSFTPGLELVLGH